MSSKKRRHFTAEKKAQIVRRHLADKGAITSATRVRDSGRFDIEHQP